MTVVCKLLSTCSVHLLAEADVFSKTLKKTKHSYLSQCQQNRPRCAVVKCLRVGGYGLVFYFNKRLSFPKINILLSLEELEMMQRMFNPGVTLK